jgi:hypothetical protein
MGRRWLRCAGISTSRARPATRILKRYNDVGLEGLTDRSRRPYRHANQLPVQIETLIVRCKQDKPHWGAPKIRERLARLYPDVHTPAISTCTLSLTATAWSNAGHGGATEPPAPRCERTDAPDHLTRPIAIVYDPFHRAARSEMAPLRHAECESARGPDADRRRNTLIYFAAEGSGFGAYPHWARCICAAF